MALRCLQSSWMPHLYKIFHVLFATHFVQSLLQLRLIRKLAHLEDVHHKSSLKVSWLSQ